MAALTMRELEAQVRALLRDASPGSMSFTPEQYAKAVNYACEQCASLLGLTQVDAIVESTLGTPSEVPIPRHLISLVSVETVDLFLDPPR